MSPVKEHAESDRNKLITTLIYINPSIAALEKICARTPLLSWGGFIKSTPPDGLGGFTTMVVVFVR